MEFQLKIQYGGYPMNDQARNMCPLSFLIQSFDALQKNSPFLHIERKSNVGQFQVCYLHTSNSYAGYIVKS